MAPPPNNFYIKDPLFTVIAAKLAGIPLALACAIITQESGGGNDVWGFDKPPSQPTAIFYDGGKYRNTHSYYTTVTQLAYDAYLAARGKATAGGQAAHEQGVGPTQLTYANVQNDADDLGGAWRPLPNLIIGFATLAADVRDKQGSTYDGLATYNGGSDAYATQVSGLRSQWEQALGEG